MGAFHTQAGVLYNGAGKPWLCDSQTQAKPNNEQMLCNASIHHSLAPANKCMAILMNPQAPPRRAELQQ